MITNVYCIFDVETKKETFFLADSDVMAVRQFMLGLGNVPETVRPFLELLFVLSFDLESIDEYNPHVISTGKEFDSWLSAHRPSDKEIK